MLHEVLPDVQRWLEDKRLSGHRASLTEILEGLGVPDASDLKGQWVWHRPDHKPQYVIGIWSEDIYAASDSTWEQAENLDTETNGHGKTYEPIGV